jgi:bifunctional ADP-heptose synthase (sugar kinase/adenylyltransferase)
MRIAIFGDLILDEHIIGVMTQRKGANFFQVERRQFNVGGAGAVAKQLAAWGHEVILLPFTSTEARFRLMDLAPFSIVFSPAKISPPLPHKKRYWVGKKLVFRADEPEIGNFALEPQRMLSCAREFEPDVIVISDYGKGAVTYSISDFAAHCGKPVYADIGYRPLERGFFYQQYNAVAQLRDYDSEGMLVELMGANGGAYKSPDGNWESWEAVPVPKDSFIDDSGCGDTFLAAMIQMQTTSSLLGENIPKAAALAALQCGFLGVHTFAKEVLRSLGGA